MARQLRVYSAAINHPDERGVPEAERTGSFITLNVMSEDLKTRPVHGIPPPRTRPSGSPPSSWKPSVTREGATDDHP